MKFFVAYITTFFLCVNAYRVRVPNVDSLSSASSEELIITPPVVVQPQAVLPQSISSISSASSEELLLQPAASTLHGVGVVRKPILRAVKVKLPQNGNVLSSNHYLAQIFAPLDATVQAGVQALS